MNKLTKELSIYIMKNIVENNFEDYEIDINELLDTFNFLKDPAIRKDVLHELTAVLNDNLIKIKHTENISTIHCIFSDIDDFLNMYNCTMTIRQLNNLVRKLLKRKTGRCSGDIFDDIELNLNNGFYYYRFGANFSLKVYFKIIQENENYEDTIVTKYHKFSFRGGEFDSNFTEGSLRLIKRLITEYIEEIEVRRIQNG
ncbi:MAG: hypothetical protein ACRC18_06950 [Cetobacterium sp.]